MKILDGETLREMTATETALYTTTITDAATADAKIRQDETALRAARLAAITKLKALGLTDNEIKTIVRQ